MGICYMSKSGSYMVDGWNLDTRGDLWVSRSTGGNKKIASGEEASAIHDELCKIAETQFPCLMHHNGMFKTNIELEGEDA